MAYCIDKQLKILLLPSPFPHPLPFVHFLQQFYFLKRIWVNSSLAWETDTCFPETLETTFLSVLFFKKFPRGACPQTPLGGSRFKCSKGTLQRQKYVTSCAFTNTSATLQNCLNPWLNYTHWFFKIRAVFHTLYLWSEVGDTHLFCIFHTSKSLSDCSKKNLSTEKIYRPEIFARTSLGSGTSKTVTYPEEQTYIAHQYGTTLSPWGKFTLIFRIYFVHTCSRCISAANDWKNTMSSKHTAEQSWDN